MNSMDANFIKNGTIEDWIVANKKTCSGEEQKGEQMNSMDANFIKNGTIEDWIVANEKTCSGEEQKGETAKELLENMYAILGEMGIEVAMIADAVYRGDEKHIEKGPALTNEPRVMPPMVVMMREQRDTAEHLLKEIIKIREALW